MTIHVVHVLRAGNVAHADALLNPHVGRSAHQPLLLRVRLSAPGDALHLFMLYVLTPTSSVAGYGCVPKHTELLLGIIGWGRILSPMSTWVELQLVNRRRQKLHDRSQP